MNTTTALHRILLPALATVAFLASGCSQFNQIMGVQTVRPQMLRTEYRVNPLGIDAVPPRLTWEVGDSRRGAVQTAYQVLVASSEADLAADKGDLWDSGKVESDQQHLVEYAGRSLASGQGCWWKVRTWDKVGEPSAWSQPALWSMGLLKADDWKGKWIGRDETGKVEAGPEAHVAKASWIWLEKNAAKDGPVGMHDFRRGFTIPESAKVKKATCSLAVDNTLTLYVNGQKAGAGYSFGQTSNVDITEFTCAGENTVAIAVSNAGGDPNPAGLIAAIVVEFEKAPAPAMPPSSWW